MSHSLFGQQLPQSPSVMNPLKCPNLISQNLTIAYIYIYTPFGLQNVPFAWTIETNNTILSISLFISLSLYLSPLSGTLSPTPTLSPFSVQITKPKQPAKFMDNMSTNTSSNSSWDLEMGIGSQILFDPHTPFELVHPMDPFHAHAPPPSGFPSGAQREVEGRGHEGELQQQQQEEEEGEEEEEQGLGAMKEMMYKIAAMQPVDIDPSTIRKPKRRNVRISDDPQSIAARHRRERISERIRILQRLVPGGTKMDTASMLDEAIRYVKFLKRQVQELQSNPQAVVHVGLVGAGHPAAPAPIGWHGSSLPSSSSAVGAPPPGIGFGFDGLNDHPMH